MMENKKPEIKRCAIYCRKSVEDGLEQEFNSLDAQREAGEAYIASQKSNGWVCLPQHYDDGGYSGANIKRPALQQLLEDVDAGKVDIIVVYKIDRLSRSICDFAELSKKFDRKNVAFVSVTQEINTHTSAGRMMLNILITFAQFEREVITERVRDKMAASRLRGKWVGGSLPLGYGVENKHLVIIPEEAEIVKMVFNRFLEIQSPKQIALEMNQSGVKTKRGCEWTTQYIYRILNNYTYIGKVNYKGKIVDGEHEGFLDEAIWKQAHEFMQNNAPIPNRVQRLETIAPLKGILRCGHCNCAMMPTYTRKNGKKYFYYICVKDTKRDISECPVKRVNSAEIENLIYEQLIRVMTAPEMIANFSRMTGIEAHRVSEMFNKEMLKEMTNGEKQRVAELLVERAVIVENGLTLEIKTCGVKSLIEEAMYATDKG